MKIGGKINIFGDGELLTWWGQAESGVEEVVGVIGNTVLANKGGGRILILLWAGVCVASQPSRSREKDLQSSLRHWERIFWFWIQDGLWFWEAKKGEVRTPPEKGILILNYYTLGNLLWGYYDGAKRIIAICICIAIGLQNVVMWSCPNWDYCIAIISPQFL